MADSPTGGSIRRVLIFNIAFMIFGVLMKLFLVPVIGNDPTWTAPDFILIEAVSLLGSAACRS